MTASTSGSARVSRLRCGIVLRVQEDVCELRVDGRSASARYAAHFPSPRRERVSPGHVVAIATAADGSDVVVWRWYDALVVGQDPDLVRMWEPAHGEVDARPRNSQRRYTPGERAYLSAGLPGADWWVAGHAVVRGENAEVELGEVERLYTENDLWGTVYEP